MTQQRYATLNTGAKIPLVGYGTWDAAPNEVYTAILEALKVGYRHIDGAWFYGNEAEVGQAIRDSGVPRNELFVTTKLWNQFHQPQDVQPALEDSLQKLGLDYVDLFLCHWPYSTKRGPGLDSMGADKDGKVHYDDENVTLAETWTAMEALLPTQKTRAIGVSNFSIPTLKEFLKTVKVVPAVNQVELHPTLPQWDLVQFCQQHGIHVTAYRPLGGGSGKSDLLTLKEIQEIADKHKATSTAQVLISWQVARGISVIPKSVTPSRIKANFEVLDLDQEDLNKIWDLSDRLPLKRYCNPSATKPGTFEEDIKSVPRVQQ